MYIDTATERFALNAFYADTATKLQTARNLTIGNSQKSFDGSNDISWSYAEMGTLPMSHPSSIDCNTIYDTGYYAIANGNNCPSGSHYGSLLTMAYRTMQGNSCPDFATQIFLPNGDDASKPDAMFYRTSLHDSWRNWQQVASKNDLSGYLPLSGGWMTGGLNFANHTWNQVGDDAAFGDCDQAGLIGIKGINGTTGFHFVANHDNSITGKILYDGNFYVNANGGFITNCNLGCNGSIISYGSGLYDYYNDNIYEMIVSYKNGNTVLGASGGALFLGYQNTNQLHIGNLGNWAYWNASNLRLGQEIQSTNVHPLRSVYGNYGLIQRNDGDRYWFLPTAYGDPWGSWAITSVSISLGTGALYGAVWNDYAEFRGQIKEVEPGYCVSSSDNGKVYKTTEKFQACDGIVSDTFGFAIGETEECKTPLAVAGRVLAYCDGSRYDYHAGDTVCAGPGGLVYKMTREEIKEYPDRVIGIVSEIPEYETWGNKAIKVNNRIWIKVK